MFQPKATIVITTRNRKEDLVKAIQSCLGQTAEPEILVIDDGSTDGTSEMITADFPQVVLHRVEESKGYIVQRNFAARMASAPFVFSIDDDACFTTPTIVEDILSEFSNPMVGAVAIPFVDVCQNPDLVRQAAPKDEGDFVISSYIGTAHALRRDLFLQLGGYREQLYHQGEESDYCLRMLGEGHVVKIGRSDVIFHYESPKRDYTRWHLYGRRNNILFAWHNAPIRYLPFMLAGTFINGIRHGLRLGRAGTMLKGLLIGFATIPGEWKQRRPVKMSTFSLYRKLVKQAPFPMKHACRSLGQHQPGKPLNMKIAVVQMGARMHYAIPRILESAGMLEQLFTDACASKGWPQLLHTVPKSLRSSRLERFLTRIPKEIPPEKITAFTGFGFDYARRLAGAESGIERDEAFLWAGTEFARLISNKGFGNAGAVYCFNTAALEIFQHAKKLGVKRVLEQTISPRAIEERLLAQEQEAWKRIFSR